MSWIFLYFGSPITVKLSRKCFVGDLLKSARHLYRPENHTLSSYFNPWDSKNFSWIYLNVLCRPSSAGIRLEMTKAAGCLSTWRIALSESVPPCINFLETGNVWQCPLHLTYAISESVPCIKVERLEISNSVLCSIDQFCLQLNLLMTWHWLSSTNNRSWVGLVSLPFHPFMWKYVCVFFLEKNGVQSTFITFTLL